MRGDGRIFRKAGTCFWHMAYYLDGREVSESTKEIDEERARRRLAKRIEDVRRGEAVPHESRVRLGEVPKPGTNLTEEQATQTLIGMLLTKYQVNGLRSLTTVRYPLQHLVDFFGAKARAVTITGDRVERYIRTRQLAGVATATINMEVALLGRAFTLAIKARRLALHRRPQVDRLPADESRIRRGFFSREEMEVLCGRLPDVLADVVRFLFFSAWRIGEVRTIEWRDYDRSEGAIRLRPEHSKNKHGRVLPVVGELAGIIERRLKARRLDCSFIFHRNGRPIGDFRKPWQRVCAELGFTGRIVHDLRRSGVRHLIRSGVPPHTVMAFSGHRTGSMLKRYDIISLDDLRDAAERASQTTPGRPGVVVPLPAAGSDTDKTPAVDRRG